MTRPVAALTSELLVRKGMARPLGLQPTEQTPVDVVREVRPSLTLVSVPADPVSEPGPRPVRRPRTPLARLARAWSMLARRWGLPTMLFTAGVGMIAVVAVTGPGPAAPAADIVAPVVRPPGPTPVSWVDDGLMAYPALAGR